MHVKVRVQANARREKVEKMSKTSFAVSVREKAAGNTANRRVALLIAAHFGVSPKAVRIINGHRLPSKLLEVRGV